MIRAAVVGDERTLAGLNSVVHEPHVAARPDQFRPARIDEVAAWFAATADVATPGVATPGVATADVAPALDCRASAGTPLADALAEVRHAA